MYKDIKEPELIKGIKFWKNKKNRFNVMMIHYSADPDKDPDRDGKEWYEKEREGATKAVWNKEYEIDFTTKSGELVFGSKFCDFDERIHFVNSHDIGDHTMILGLDFGQRNPTCGLVAKVDSEGRIYIVDEYYKPAIPSVSSKEMFQQFGYLIPGWSKGLVLADKKALANNAFDIKVIDPTTAHKNRTKYINGEEIPYSVIEDFDDNGWSFEKGNNDWEAGITRIREYFQIKEDGRPSLYVFEDKCPNLAYEIKNYKYQEHKESSAKTKNESEKPVKKKDHAVDCLRYILMSRPMKPTPIPAELTRVQRHIRSLINKPSITMDN